MDIIDGPAVVERPERHTVGIREITPFRGMFAVRDRHLVELFAWSDVPGPAFFRLHTVDMAGDMEIETGIVVPGPVAAAGRIRPGVLPPGRYATMTYVNHGMRANKTLLGWIGEQGLDMDVTASPSGDKFGCRYEAYLTDPRAERMKTRWQIELAVRLA